MYRSVILHVSLASTLLYSVALLNCLLQRKKVSPKGLTFVRCASDSTTSLAVRSVALWVVGKPVGFCLSHLMALLLPLSLLLFI